jgi:hypothetical protein
LRVADAAAFRGFALRAADFIVLLF